MDLGWKAGFRYMAKRLNAAKRLTGAYDNGVPPVPIPNTEVKPLRAEGTWLDTARKTRSLPESISGDTMCLLFLLDWGQSFAARLGAALQRRGTSCSCARSARAEHDSGSGLQPLLAAYTPPLRMAQEGTCRPFLHPRRSVFNLSLNLAAQGSRTRRACRRVRMAVGGLRPSKPPQMGLSTV